MELLAVCIAALLASALTLFSGFGLGTLLMPVNVMPVFKFLVIATSSLMITLVIHHFLILRVPLLRLMGYAQGAYSPGSGARVDLEHAHG